MVIFICGLALHLNQEVVGPALLDRGHEYLLLMMTYDCIG
jgi:hypothetical protein